MAKVYPGYVVIGNAGGIGFTVVYAGRDYVFRTFQTRRWEPILKDLEMTLEKHRLRSRAIACRKNNYDGIELWSEVELWK